jgi:protein involved in polysaccharide export with SLBB domain
MFQPLNAKGELDESQLTKQLALTAGQYQVQTGDLLRVRVFTNGGESILDPNGELRFGSPGGLGSVNPSAASGGSGGTAMGTAPGGASADELPGFTVQPDGRVRLPLVGYVAVKNQTLLQIDSVLQVKYAQFYKDVFVETRLANGRVIVLGAPGKGSMVVSLTNDPTSLLDVLAQAGGIPENSRANNIRLIRGTDPKTALVHQIDLSTIEGMRQANLQVTANDVVYIEPVRRPGVEFLRDYGRVFAILTGIGATLGILLQVLK